MQEFEDFSSDNYWNALNLKKGNKKVLKEDKEETRKIAELLFAIHNTSTSLSDPILKNRMYNDGLYSVFTAQDLYFFFLHTFDKNHPFFPPSKHGKYTSEMINLFHEFKDNGNRLKPLHGDFWGTNLHKKKDESWYVVDYSRIPYGEPGVDVSAWIAQYLWLYHETGNKIYKDLGEEFLKHYEKISGDKKIRTFMSLPMGLWGLIWVNPHFYPERTGNKARLFFKTIIKIIKNKKFCWE